MSKISSQNPMKKSLISAVIALVADLPVPLRQLNVWEMFPVGGSDACYSCNVIMLIRLDTGHFQGAQVHFCDLIKLLDIIRRNILIILTSEQLQNCPMTRCLNKCWDDSVKAKSKKKNPVNIFWLRSLKKKLKTSRRSCTTLPAIV